MSQFFAGSAVVDREGHVGRVQHIKRQILPPVSIALACLPVGAEDHLGFIISDRKRSLNFVDRIVKVIIH
ncbi:hypothetical protein D3C76_1724050 [compost metagenome]